MQYMTMDYRPGMVKVPVDGREVVLLPTQGPQLVRDTAAPESTVTIGELDEAGRKAKFDFNKRDAEIRIDRAVWWIVEATAKVKQMESKGYRPEEHEYVFKYLGYAGDELETARLKTVELLQLGLITRDDMDRWLTDYSALTKRIGDVSAAARNLQIAYESTVKIPFTDITIAPLGSYIKFLMVALGGLPGLFGALNGSTQSLALIAIATGEAARQVAAKIPEFAGDLWGGLKKLLPWVLGGAAVLLLAPSILGGLGASRTIQYRRNPRGRRRGVNFLPFALGGAAVWLLAQKGQGAVIPTVAARPSPDIQPEGVLGSAGSLTLAGAVSAARLALGAAGIAAQVRDTGTAFDFMVPVGKIPQATLIVDGIRNTYEKLLIPGTV